MNRQSKPSPSTAGAPSKSGGQSHKKLHALTNEQLAHELINLYLAGRTDALSLLQRTFPDQDWPRIINHHRQARAWSTRHQITVAE